MKNAQVSSAYVVDEQMHLKGIITLEDTIRAKNENLQIEDVLIEIFSVSLDTYITDLIDTMTISKYPLAVIDEEKQLQGILTKVNVLSLLK
nr:MULTISPECIES: CBS domain-containing protein [unclassified Breznakia]